LDELSIEAEDPLSLLESPHEARAPIRSIKEPFFLIPGGLDGQPQGMEALPSRIGLGLLQKATQSRLLPSTEESHTRSRPGFNCLLWVRWVTPDRLLDGVI
jgi:hypothetical protein